MGDPNADLGQQITKLRDDLDRLKKIINNGTGNGTQKASNVAALDCGTIQVRSPNGSMPLEIRAEDDRAGIYFYDRSGACRALVEVTEKGGRFEIRTGEGKSIVLIKGIDDHGQVSVCSPDGMARAAMRSTKHGGVVKVLNAHGRPLGFLFGCETGGVLELNN